MKRIFIPFCALMLGSPAALADTEATADSEAEEQYRNTYTEGETRLPNTYTAGDTKLPSTFIEKPDDSNRDSWWRKIRATGSIQSEFLFACACFCCRAEFKIFLG